MTTPKPLTIVQLYPRDMNIYGDWGNVLTVKKRAQWHGYQPEIIGYNPGDTWPDQVDMVLGGGGQDSGQDKVAQDLQQRRADLHHLANDDVPMLVICGLYQLFGHHFTTDDGHTIKGIGLLDVTTSAGPERIIGNIVTHSDQFGDIIGYENHSGLTNLGPGATPLGRVIKGGGNTGTDGTEGARYRQVIGSYLHGSLLPKNPTIADWLIEQAAMRRYGDFTPTVIDDRFAQAAREASRHRPR